MTRRLAETPRDSLMLAAEQELIAFELKERELQKQVRLERAKLKFPALVELLQSQESDPGHFEG